VIQPQSMTNNIATVDLSQATLMDSLTALAGIRSRGVTFYDAKGRPERLSYDELWREALRFAAGLRKLKLAPGDPLVLILTDPKDAIIAILGSIGAGGQPAAIDPRMAMIASLGSVRIKTSGSPGAILSLRSPAAKRSASRHSSS